MTIYAWCFVHFLKLVACKYPRLINRYKSFFGDSQKLVNLMHARKKIQRLLEIRWMSHDCVVTVPLNNNYCTKRIFNIFSNSIDQVTAAGARSFLSIYSFDLIFLSNLKNFEIQFTQLWFKSTNKPSSFHTIC